MKKEHRMSRGAEKRQSQIESGQENPPWPRPGFDTLWERLIEHNGFVKLRHMATKSRQGRPKAPFNKGDLIFPPFEKGG